MNAAPATLAAPAAAPRGAAARPRLIANLLVRHVEEMAYLWERRCAVRHAPDCTVRQFGELNERIEAHTQGLLVAGPALLEFARPLMASAERGEAFAGAYSILRANRPDWTAQVIGTFAAADGAGLRGIRDALCAFSRHAALDVRDVLEKGDPLHAVSAAAVLAAGGRLDAAAPRLAALLLDENPDVAQMAWWVALRVDDIGTGIRRPFEPALGQPHAGVQSAALGAAIWRGEPWARDRAQRLAQGGSAGALQWLAAIGESADLPVLRAAVAGQDGAAPCLELAGRFGHCAMIELLLGAMASDDPAQAAAAALEFARIVGVEVRGQRRTLAVADDADEFEREFAPQVWLPDLAKAGRLWQQNAEKWRAGERWCRGHEIARSLPRSAQPWIDLQAFWDFGARAALAGKRAFAPPELW